MTCDSKINLYADIYNIGVLINMENMWWCLETGERRALAIYPAIKYA